MNKARTNILLVIVGLAAGLLAAELFFRAGGFFLDQRAAVPVRAADGTGTVLCLGDSFTFGLGVPREESYPAHLERILNERPGQRVTVINGGRPGSNTAEILAALPTQLEHYRPRVVVLLAGCNNEWNYRGYRSYVDRTGWRARWETRVWGIRCVRFFAWLRSAVRGRAPGVRGDPAVVIEEEPSVRHDPASEEYYRKAQDCRRERAWGLFERYCLKAMELDPGDLTGYFLLGDYHRDRGRFAQAFQLYKQGIALRPRDILNRSYAGLKQLYVKGDQPIRDAVLAYARSLRDGQGIDDPNVRDILAMARTGSAYAAKNWAWAVHDIDEIISLCERHQARLVLQGYPRDHQLNPLLRALARRRGVVFIDNEAVVQAVAAREGQDKYFRGDGHLTGKGNELMARTIAGKIDLFTR